MQVNELTGALLDYWVARADPKRDGIRWEQQGADWIGFGRIGSSPEFACWIVTNASSLHERAALRDKHLSARFYEPSKDWAQGGPIVEREKIGVTFGRVSDQWYAMVQSGGIGPRLTSMSDTPLVAAMRAYVASKFGDTVPDDIAQ